MNQGHHRISASFENLPDGIIKEHEVVDLDRHAALDYFVDRLFGAKMALAPFNKHRMLTEQRLNEGIGRAGIDLILQGFEDRGENVRIADENNSPTPKIEVLTKSLGLVDRY